MLFLWRKTEFRGLDIQIFSLRQYLQARHSDTCLQSEYHLYLHGEFQASLGYMKSCIKKMDNNIFISSELKVKLLNFRIYLIFLNDNVLKFKLRGFLMFWRQVKLRILSCSGCLYKILHTLPSKEHKSYSKFRKLLSLSWVNTSVKINCFFGMGGIGLPLVFLLVLQH